MSKTGRPNPRRGQRGTRKTERRIMVRAIRRHPPDLRKLSRAVIAMALREAETEADANAAQTDKTPHEEQDGRDASESSGQEGEQ